jgi:hypothetical protein
MKLFINLFVKALNYFGWYNLMRSKKYNNVLSKCKEVNALKEVEHLINQVIIENNTLDGIKSINKRDFDQIELNKPKLFQYWHQGINNLPEVISNCYQSVDYFLQDEFEIIRLDYDSIKDYIQLPNHILKAQKDQRMSIAHFSDIIRNKLLFEFGGLWLDSSVLVTSKEEIIKFIDNKEISFHNSLILDNPKEHPILIGSWIIWSARPGMLIFDLTQKTLEKFWLNNKFINNYFLFHIIVSELLRRVPIFLDVVQWHKKNYLPYSCDLLFFYLQRPFSLEEFKLITNKSGVHKLDFKLKISPEVENNTFYHLLYSKAKFDNDLWKTIINNL